MSRPPLLEWSRVDWWTIVACGRRVRENKKKDPFVLSFSRPSSIHHWNISSLVSFAAECFPCADSSVCWLLTRVRVSWTLLKVLTFKSQQIVEGSTRVRRIRRIVPKWKFLHSSGLRDLVTRLWVMREIFFFFLSVETLSTPCKNTLKMLCHQILNFSVPEKLTSRVFWWTDKQQITHIFHMLQIVKFQTDFPLSRQVLDSVFNFKWIPISCLVRNVFVRNGAEITFKIHEVK